MVSVIDYATLFTAFATLFVVIDPIGLAPIFVALTQGMAPQKRKAIALRACVIAFVILSLFGLLGDSVLGFAGISMPSSKASKATEAIERIKSYDFFVNQFLPNVQLKDLIAANDWQQNSNSIIYNNNIYNIKDNTWTREASFPKTSMPSNQEAYEVYKEILSISEDKKTSFVTISITHVSPFIAKDWVDIIITNINAHMREIDISIAENSIVFLKETLITTSLSDIRRAMAQLLQDQIQVLMLAEASQDYIFKRIVSPIAPEKKSAPSRALICILGTLIGFMISVLLSLYLHYSKKNKY